MERQPIRNRVVEVVQVRAGDLVPNPKNWRRHPERQRRALDEALGGIGLADVLKARRLGDGRLMLLDGHMRAEETPDEIWHVAVLDITEDEEALFLATYDPLAALAEAEAPALAGLVESIGQVKLPVMSQEWRGLIPRATPEATGGLIRDFGEPPTSVFYTRSGRWQDRKAYWYDRWRLRHADLGRPRKMVFQNHPQYLTKPDGAGRTDGGTSQFDPVLAELMIRWYSPAGGLVMDPFAGGVERGLMAAELGRTFLGIDLSPRQVDHNNAEASRLGLDGGATWVVGDSTRKIPSVMGSQEADLLFACPPYWNLERYSDDPADLSNMDLAGFESAHQVVVEDALDHLRDNRFAVWVIGDVRGPDGEWCRLPQRVVHAFQEAGAELVNEAVLISVLSSQYRVRRGFLGGRSLLPAHEYVLVFCKGDRKAAAQELGAPTGAELEDSE